MPPKKSPQREQLHYLRRAPLQYPLLAIVVQASRLHGFGHAIVAQASRLRIPGAGGTPAHNRFSTIFFCRPYAFAQVHSGRYTI